MFISSPDFEESEKIPEIFTCDGNDKAPDFLIGDVPDDAKSLSLIMEDPDGPIRAWTHWIIWNIPPETKTIIHGMVPKVAVEGLTSSGNAGYHGPCPPDGEHRYYFHLYALDTMLDLPEDSDRHKLEQAMASHTLESTYLMGTYGKEPE